MYYTISMEEVTLSSNCVPSVPLLMWESNYILTVAVLPMQPSTWRWGKAAPPVLPDNPLKLLTGKEVPSWLPDPLTLYDSYLMHMGGFGVYIIEDEWYTWRGIRADLTILSGTPLPVTLLHTASHMMFRTQRSWFSTIWLCLCRLPGNLGDFIGLNVKLIGLLVWEDFVLIQQGQWYFT